LVRDIGFHRTLYFNGARPIPPNQSVEALYAHVAQLRDHAERMTRVNQLRLALEPIGKMQE